MSAHNYPEVYWDLGIDLRTLGCVMLAVEQPDTSFIPDDVLYTSTDPNKFWINGRTEDSHLTLKYGLLPQVRRHHVRAVLRETSIPNIILGAELMKFDSPYTDEEYDCIVMRIETDPAIPGGGEVKALHNQLNYLPNISTFPDYRPHVTLAYTRKGWYDEYMESNTGGNIHTPLNTLDLDFGKML